MIKKASGNLLSANVEALVNTVNCVGYMGKGIALQFKKKFPHNYDAYHKACKAGEVVPGKMNVFETGGMINPRYIINFPTKRHWRNPSRMEDVESGLVALIDVIKQYGIRSIAIPPLGCGLGGLDWNEIKPRIEQAFSELTDVEVYLYEPKGAPAAKDQPVNTKKPKMTRARALLIMLMDQYKQLDYALTLLEIHKLAYFLEAKGEPLKLDYVRHIYGPYAKKLRHVLTRIEGHYIRGFGDNENPNQEIELLDGAIDEAKAYIGSDEDAQQRLSSVAKLIEGFETPYGMELLASVHWLADKEHIDSEDDMARELENWSDRKARMFSSYQVKTAMAQLRQ
ncbi:type II toxin-antitoxin system antitoxin DNA ADP-ribosyl glycohydrolase DarG [Kistimonas asteriae]|uniref:type II toxin-antitoxin system antitoxin DNA ADP-ribosyl glycohydrolase DarG n=1 Tax=Kistimonas asteriae TaxID=517724 RepID=UPI001BAB8935|nr:macro domain-containing protein [Kistimonas asteriae]